MRLLLLIRGAMDSWSRGRGSRRHDASADERMMSKRRQQPWMLLLLLLMMMLVGGSLMVLKFHLVATAHHELLATCPENPNIPPLQVLDLGDQSALSYITSHWLKERYGHLYVHAAESSRVREDMTNAEDGGLGERKMLLRTFLDGFEENRHETYPFNYVKVVDPEYSEAFANPKEINLLGALGPIVLSRSY